ncbi:MAG: hypothetical protein HY735_30020, partial [Verrucomicrobia bacterium]|nr:hypothetical protein [Verrucomicrobiota bacterium]
GVSPSPLEGREKFSKTQIHSRDCAPKDCDQFHDLAKELLSDRRSEVLGWQFLFEGLTGCRTNEICQLRIDAQSRDVSGFIEEDRWLWLKRSKGRGESVCRFVGPSRTS